ncbi:MAG: metallophosphoesterase [Motiliproteus sp.]
MHQGGLESYRRIGALLAKLNIPWYWIPGNHDCAEAMTALWGRITRKLQLQGWLLTLLDSTSDSDGRGSGSLADSELDFLRQQLQVDANHLLVLHHNPIAVDSQWQQAISLGNAQEFNQILANSSRQGAVIFGHLHQHWDIQSGHWRMLACPSSAVQFRKYCEHFEVETLGLESWPGYRWLTLFADGKLDTGVERCDPNQLTE